MKYILYLLFYLRYFLNIVLANFASYNCTIIKKILFSVMVVMLVSV